MNNSKIFLLVFFAALILRSPLIFKNSAETTDGFIDMRLARNLGLYYSPEEGSRYFGQTPLPPIRENPLYPVLIKPFLPLFSNYSFMPGRIVTLISGALACGILALLAFKLVNNPYLGIFSGLLLAVNPVHFYWGIRTKPEMTANLLAVLAFYALVRREKSGDTFDKIGKDSSISEKDLEKIDKEGEKSSENCKKCDLFWLLAPAIFLALGTWAHISTLFFMPGFMLYWLIKGLKKRLIFKEFVAPILLFGLIVFPLFGLGLGSSFYHKYSSFLLDTLRAKKANSFITATTDEQHISPHAQNYFSLKKNALSHIKALPYALGWSPLILAFFGLFQFGKYKDQAIFIPIISALIITGIVQIFWRAFQLRHYMSALPFLALFSAMGLSIIAKKLGKLPMGLKKDKNATNALIFVLALIILIHSYSISFHQAWGLWDIFGDFHRAFIFLLEYIDENKVPEPYTILSSDPEKARFYFPKAQYYSENALIDGALKGPVFILYSAYKLESGLCPDIPFCPQISQFESQFYFNYPSAPLLPWVNTYYWLDNIGKKAKHQSKVYRLDRDDLLSSLLDKSMQDGEYIESTIYFQAMSEDEKAKLEKVIARLFVTAAYQALEKKELEKAFELANKALEYANCFGDFESRKGAEKLIRHYLEKTRAKTEK